MRRFIFRSVATALVAAALAAAPAGSSAQVRRSGGGSTDSTAKVNRSNTGTSKNGTTQVNRSNTSSSKSGGSQVNRSGSNSTSKSSGSQVNRSGSNSTSKSGSSQVNRSDTGTSKNGTTQVNRSTKSNDSKSGTTQVNRSGDSSKSTSTVRRSTSTTGSGTVSGGSTGSSTTSGGKIVRSVRENGSSSSGTSSSSTARSATSSNGSTGLTQISSGEDDPQVDRSGNVVRRNLSVTGKGLGGSNDTRDSRNTGVQGSQNRGNEPVQPALNSHSRGQMRMDDRRDLYRIPPKDRDFMTYDRIGHFYRPEFHYFGYRVKTLPPSYRSMRHWGRSYYYCDDVYYTRYGSYYRVCRPPFGVVIDMTLNDLAFASVRFAYYHNVYRDFSRLDSNYRTILQQNRIIAKNNALIAQQNSLLALNSSRALSAYEIADALNLVQSYAGIDTEYYYEDGVFYTVNSRGRYEVIVPPAGALIDQLPDDYDTIVLGGVEYYRVDDTVYRLTLVDGSPYLEVLGQLTGSLAQLY